MEAKTNSYIVARIEAIQRELEQVKKVFAYRAGNSKRKTELKGLWKGVEVTEEDIEEAKKSLFREAYNFESRA